MCPLIWYLKVVKVSVVSDYLQPQGLQPTRPLFPWNSPGKERKPTGVGCHILLQVIFSTQGPTLVLVYCRLIDSLLFEPPGSPTNLTLNLHKQVWFAPEFHLLIICPEVKLDGLRALVWKFALASLSVLVCYCTWHLGSHAGELVDDWPELSGLLLLFRNWTAFPGSQTS